MKQKRNGGFSLVEILVSMAILAAAVIPVCTSMVVAARLNAKAEATMQARLAVSSAVEILMAEGITAEADDYKPLDATVDFSNVTVKTVLGSDATHYIVTVTDKSEEPLVTVTTKIRAKPPVSEEQGGAG